MTVEAALVTVALMLTMWLCLGGVFAGLAYVRCVDAAREAALGVARGDTAAVDRARRAAPRGAAIEIVGDRGSVVTARVVARSPVLPLLTLRAESVTVIEGGGSGR
ncbi:TadE family type IV pilus minor pilin [Hoyosella altamirensis]|uniref:Pilus assembly protein TadE n=1 Tax=Hoyosella altamirensis TaxID=616997 RepID=A0A839RP42_9ACTN|nr:TadE family type IV pilus minor pilin [Hoyosella altamirensis]MBB3037816.1 hypothetical protein [Hoyosella altamirensis]